MKTICIQIENGLYTDRFLISQKSCFDLKKFVSHFFVFKIRFHLRAYLE